MAIKIFSMIHNFPGVDPQLYSNATELINGCLEKSPGPVDHWAQIVSAQHRSQPEVDTSSFNLAVKDSSSQESL